MAILRTLNETMQEIRTSPQPRIAVETMLIGLCHASETVRTEHGTAVSNPADATRIAWLEEEVRRLSAQLAAAGAGKTEHGSAEDGAANAAIAAPKSAGQTMQNKAAPKHIPKAGHAAESVSGTPRQLDAALWKSFQTRLKECNRLAFSLLSGADYEGATETHFFIRPATDMARDYIMKRHRVVFEEVMCELVGRPMLIVCTGGEEDVPPAPHTPKAPEYPAPVTELLKIAGEGARVEEVTVPAKRSGAKPLSPPVPTESDEVYEVYEPTPDEEAEMFEDDALPPDEGT